METIITPVQHCRKCFGIFKNEQTFKAHKCRGLRTIAVSHWDIKDYPEFAKYFNGIKITYFADFCLATLPIKRRKSTTTGKGDTPEEAIITAVNKLKDTYNIKTNKRKD